MTVTTYIRGHKVEFLNGEWVYSDDKTPVSGKERPCKKCGRMPSPEGYDACLGYIPGAESACCGHGIEDGYIIYKDGREEILPNERRIKEG